MPDEWTGVLAIEGEPTGDGRMIEAGATRWDDGPWALIWDREDGDHTGITVGSVTNIWRDGNLIRGSGFWSESDDPEAAADILRARELVDEGAVGVSVALDSEVVSYRARINPEGGETEMAPGLIGDIFLDIAGHTRPWSAAAARNRVFAAFTVDGVVDEWEVSRAFLYRDPDGDPQAKTSYKFGIADVVNGTLRIVPRAVAAAAAAIKASDLAARSELARMVCGLYARMATFGECPFTDERETIGTWVHDDVLAVITEGRVRHLAIVDTPAFADARIGLVAVGIVAAGAGVATAFADPRFGRSTADDDRLVPQDPERPGEAVTYGAPLTITAEGEVYGHAALWGRCHSGFRNACVIPPKGGDYSRFLHGEAAPGIRTGVLTVGTTHASLAASAQMAMDHYSHTGRAVADVTVGEDHLGLWVSGRLRPGVSDRDLADLRGSSLSGDWRPANGKYRLCGLLAVNQPGYLVQRPAIAASDGIITAGPCSCEYDGVMEDLDGSDAFEVMGLIAAQASVINALSQRLGTLEELVRLDLENRVQIGNAFSYASGGAGGEGAVTLRYIEND